MLTESTKRNLERKAGWVDRVQYHNGVPLWSYLEFSPTELCSRACAFCPRSDPTEYPNQPLSMPISLAQKMAGELRSLNYEGGVVACGYGEPILHPNLVDLMGCFKGLRTEIVTSGDRLTPHLIRALSEAGVTYFIVSLYDGDWQIEKFTQMFAEAGCDNYILRDRWHSDTEDFGLKLTNRAGTVTAGHQPAVDTMRPCTYPSYALMIDWQGDSLLCCQDWRKRVKLGNVSLQTLLEVWTGKIAMKHRKRLIAGRRDMSPCIGCNVEGTVHGARHAEAWSGGKVN